MPKGLSGWRGVAVGLVLAAAIAVSVGLVIDSGDDSQPSAEVAARKLVAGYCLYRTSAVPEFGRCLDEVDAATVRADQSHAAQYARHELPTCEEDAGELCGPLYREVVETRAEEEAEQLLRGD
jgi:hypothetical protein